MQTQFLITGNDNLSRIAQCSALAALGYDVTEARSLHDAETYLKCGLQPQVLVLNMKTLTPQVTALMAFVRQEVAGGSVCIVLAATDADTYDGPTPDVYLTQPIDPVALLNMLGLHQAA